MNRHGADGATVVNDRCLCIVPHSYAGWDWAIVHLEVLTIPISKADATSKFVNLVNAQTLDDANPKSPESEPCPDESGLAQTHAAAQKILRENPTLAKILKRPSDQ
jgi:hypothetical protein